MAQIDPSGCPKSPLLKVQSAFWAILAGVELTEGCFSDRLPQKTAYSAQRAQGVAEYTVPG